MRLSSRRDVDAPVRLNMSERNDLFNEPVLIQMRADRRKVNSLAIYEYILLNGNPSVGHDLDQHTGNPTSRA